ncbi:arginine--tRNA ligase [Crocinitomix algicola]|uniref:arginine--tRNA ligase n=1 Tax=Crocinitomix algicola TaxID=1740263 RepID=UPI00082E8AA5|nr:arginine--tRNA ligase [Crocinitomix algicola]
MSLDNKLTIKTLELLSDFYEQAIDANLIQFQKTRKDFEGDITLVVFPLAKIAKKSPPQTGDEIGQLLVDKIDYIGSFNTVQGFLNLVITDQYWLEELKEIETVDNYGIQPRTEQKLMVEYSSPNTNKPLHLGHLRNNFLGHSVARILEANGHEVIKTQIINDRGIHICKSMLAWQRFGNGETPENSGIKGDKLVGKYYVKFDQALKEETEVVLAKWGQGEFDVENEVMAEYQRLSLAATEKEDAKSRKGILDKIKKLANNSTPIMKDVKEMLVKWEAKEPEVYELWEKMNGWVYEGFNKTYEAMGVHFDKLYYESDTYLKGKKLVEQGLKDNVFFQKEDQSVWIDLTDEGLDEKLVLRGDGTAVYVTQDMGTAQQRMEDFPGLSGIVYTVGNEQDYHFNVLFKILQKLGYKWAENCFHLSYGMIDLRNDKGEVGKMKSREGTVVDADDLVKEVVKMAQEMTEERGHIEGMTEEEKNKLYQMIGLGGLKYYLLKVDPTKRMTFNPDESVELNGNTGPFIQYVYARISSLLRSAGNFSAQNIAEVDGLIDVEKELVKKLVEYPQIVIQAGEDHSPAIIANYIYDLGKNFNSLWQNVSVLKEENQAKREMRLILSKNVAKVIKSGMYLLGIDVPERM